jgi:hypothetical protein
VRIPVRTEGALQPAAARVQPVEQGTRPVAVPTSLDHVLKQAAGITSITVRDRSLGAFEPFVQDPARFRGHCARLVKATAGFGMIRVFEEDAPEDVGRLDATTRFQKLTPLREQSPKAVRLVRL